MYDLLQQMGLGSEFWHKDPEKWNLRTMGTSMKTLKLLASHLLAQLPSLTLARL